MGDKIIIGGYAVEGIEMLDDATCCLYFEAINEGHELITIVAEKWLDEDKFVSMDNYYEEDGNFIDCEETTYLTDEDKEKCKEFINSWIENLDK